MNKLLLLDKDGTLISSKSGAKFVSDPWDQAPLPNVSDTLKKYAAEGWEIAIISNQGGVAANHKSLANCILEMKFCLQLFSEIKEAYFCPDFEGSECWRVWDDCSEECQIQISLSAIVQLNQCRLKGTAMIKYRFVVCLQNQDTTLFYTDTGEFSSLEWEAKTYCNRGVSAALNQLQFNKEVKRFRKKGFELKKIEKSHGQQDASKLELLKTVSLVRQLCF